MGPHRKCQELSFDLSDEDIRWNSLKLFRYVYALWKKELRFSTVNNFEI